MLSDRRLTEAYENAEVRYFGKESRYVIFSDCHRGDDSASDEFTRNQTILIHALDYYFGNGYVYVEAGDGDELWEYSDFKDIRLAHGDVFTAMKKLYGENRLILLYGNHNIYLKSRSFVRKNYYSYYDEYSQQTCDLFHGIAPREALVLKDRDSGREILIVHGHQGDLMNDRLWVFSMLTMRYFWRFVHVVGFQNPTSPAKKLYKSAKIENKYRHWIEKSGKFLICGHTHRPKFSEPGEAPYFNSGCCIHTKGIPCIEITGGGILMADWRVKADPSGGLRVERTVIRGPVPIGDYSFGGASGSSV